MARPTNTREARTLVHQREQVIEKILRTEPEDTPVISGMQVKSTTALQEKYQRDSLRAPNAENAALEGDDAGDARATTQPAVLEGSLQIFRDVIQTSGTAEAVGVYGRSSEQGWQTAKAMLELKRDAEMRAISKLPAQARTALLAPKTAALAPHIYTNALHGVGGATAAHTTGLPTTAITAGTARAFTADLFEAASQAMFTASGSVAPLAVMSPAHKVAFSQFTGLSHIRENTPLANSGEAEIYRGAEYYRGNFARVRVQAHYMMVGATHVLMLDQKYNDLVFLRGWAKLPLGRTGDSVKEMIIAEVGFRVRAEKPQAVIHDLS